MPDRIPFYSDAAWWGEQAVAWLVFSVLVAALLGALQYALEVWRQDQFKRWHLAVWGVDRFDPARPKAGLQELYWEEVRRIRESPFERWKLVKSVMSGFADVKLGRIDKADKVWCGLDVDRRLVIVDLNRIPDDHAKWKKDVPLPVADSPAWGEHRETAKARWPKPEVAAPASGTP